MTLATDFWVTSPISVPQREELWQLGRELIYRFSARPGPAEYTDDPVWEPTAMRPGVRDRDHEIGQGFCSMYDFRYQLLSLPVETYSSIPHEDDCEPDCTYHHDSPANGWYVRIRLDTGYGYRTESPDGRATTWGCGDLHAAIVSALGAWLSARDISWHWKNEFTGEIHEGRDGLDALGMSGARAHEWLTNTVRPAISAAHPEAEVTWF